MSAQTLRPVFIDEAEYQWSIECHGHAETERRMDLLRHGLCPLHPAGEQAPAAVVAGIHENGRGERPVAYCQEHADVREAAGTFTPLDGAR